MNIIVIGLGSMGKRRIRLLKQYIKENEVKSEWNIYGVDAKEERRKEANDTLQISAYSSITEVFAAHSVDAAVISTSPLSHQAIIKECLNRDLHVFTEINLVSDGYDENIQLAKDKNKVLFLSSTPMYRKEMEYIKRLIITTQRKYTYRYHIGQYLPEWHPWENYKDYFVGDKRTNGCREIFAIEMPWMIDAFGEVEEIQSIHSKITDLSLDYDDTYQVIIRHKSGIVGQLSVDVSTPKTERHLELWTENQYYEWRGTGDSLLVRNNETKELEPIYLYKDIVHEEGYNNFVVENAYYDELVEYIEAITDNIMPRYSFEKDIEVLNWIDKIEK